VTLLKETQRKKRDENVACRSWNSSETKLQPNNAIQCRFTRLISDL